MVLPMKFALVGDYDEGVLMLMYDDVVITKEVDLLRDYHD